ncbi:hypothetical protein ACIU1J_06355 [Azospirillum doebereinerae]|uniref:CRISPR-associated protein Cas4 n=1 Tax=Azospirillum doebereinerae TaxID=92933 RepID=UPI003851464F
MDEDDLLPLSALQHHLFCPRQCALIHVERQWRENRFTAEGRLLHDTVDSGGRDRRGNVRTVRSMPLRSHRLGLAGGGRRGRTARPGTPPLPGGVQARPPQGPPRRRGAALRAGDLPGGDVRRRHRRGRPVLRRKPAALFRWRSTPRCAR